MICSCCEETIFEGDDFIITDDEIICSNCYESRIVVKYYLPNRETYHDEDEVVLCSGIRHAKEIYNTSLVFNKERLEKSIKEENKVMIEFYKEQIQEIENILALLEE